MEPVGGEQALDAEHLAEQEPEAHGGGAAGDEEPVERPVKGEADPQQENDEPVPDVGEHEAEEQRDHQRDHQARVDLAAAGALDQGVEDVERPAPPVFEALKRGQNADGGLRVAGHRVYAGLLEQPLDGVTSPQRGPPGHVAETALGP